MKNKIGKIISIISVAPLIALYVLTALFLHDANLFGNNALWVGISIFFLTLMPLSAYLLEHVLPAFKTAGRKGERKLAFAMCIAGYVLGTIVSFVFHAPLAVKMVFTSYMVSGGILALVNGLIKFKASGHACGVAGPCVVLLYFMGAKVWYIILTLAPVFWARITMGRHSLKELISGAMIGMGATGLTIAAFLFVSKLIA
ncbi:MAG TPA: hypothetical protein PLL88_05405 [Anaerolineaceae bacterium]|nr:hypothetical protein [Anaerolineaceae bacterium]